MSSNTPRFDADRSKAVLRRAVELEDDEEPRFSENDVRMMAAELQIRPDAIERALREAAGGVLAPTTQNGTTALRRWSILALVLAAGGIAAVLAPDVLTESGLVAGYAFAVLLSVASAQMLRAHERQQASVRLANDGVHYSTRVGPQTMKWTSVLRVRSMTPGAVSLEAPGQSISIRLASFGDPDTVLALIKLRVAFASPGTNDQ